MKGSSMTPDDIKRKIDELQKRQDVVVKKRASLNGQLQAKKEELASIVQEVRAAGYDPKNLSGERDKAQQELERALADFEAKLVEVETALESFNK